MNNGPVWLQYLIGFGTAGAAVFAGFAARAAKNAASSSEALVKVETERDKLLADEARWRQARRITVDLAFETAPVDCGAGRMAYETFLVVTNSSPDPIRKVRLQILLGDAIWGPQLIGTVAPGGRVETMARLVTNTPGIGSADGLARFVDVLGQYWVASVRNAVQMDERKTDDWIAEAEKFARRPKQIEERGTISGAILPDFNSWRDQLRAADGSG